jgi:hypothetical protein
VRLEERITGPADHMVATPGGEGIAWTAYPAGGGTTAGLTTRVAR